MASIAQDTPRIVRSEVTGFRKTLQTMRKEWTAYLFLTPTMIWFSVFWIFAVTFSLYLSFHRWNILEPDKVFIGLENYARLLQDERFHRALFNTLYYTAFSVPLTMMAGLFIALLLNNKIRFRGIFRTLYYIPNITPLIVSAIIWKWLYQGDYGLINYYLLQLGVIKDPVRWLSDPDLAMPAVIFSSIWGGAGYQMVIYLAGLQAIPGEFYDAAKVDGANALQRLRYVTLPLLNPTTLFLFITSVISSIQIIAQIYVMTGGGPINRTTTVGYYLYEKAFRHFDAGYASAMSYAMFGLIFVLTVFQLRFLRRDIQY
jgi:multiple sugar transport system permease protein